MQYESSGENFTQTASDGHVPSMQGEIVQYPPGLDRSHIYPVLDPQSLFLEQSSPISRPQANNKTNKTKNLAFIFYDHADCAKCLPYLVKATLQSLISLLCILSHLPLFFQGIFYLCHLLSQLPVFHLESLDLS